MRTDFETGGGVEGVLRLRSRRRRGPCCPLFAVETSRLETGRVHVRHHLARANEDVMGIYYSYEYEYGTLGHWAIWKRTINSRTFMYSTECMFSYEYDLDTLD